MRERVPADLRARARRVGSAGPAILQTAGAAGASWYLATLVPGHDRPFFASIAALVALGSTRGRRGRQAIEVMFGVVAGIAVADLLSWAIGYGAFQIVAVVALAMGITIFAGRGPLFVSQAAVWGILVIGVPSQSGGFGSERFYDALIGAGVALVVSQVLFPVNPLALLSQASKPVLEELRAVLAATADALENRDEDKLEAALERSRDLGARMADLREAVSVGRDAARLAPARRRARPGVSRYADLAAQVDLAVRNVHVLAAAAARLTGEGEEAAPDVAEALRDLCEAVDALGRRVEGEEDADVERWAARASDRAGRIYEEHGSLAVAVVAHQIESTAYDLLRGSGLDRSEASEAVRASP